MKFTAAEIKDIIGSLSNPSKMPGYSYGLPRLKSCPSGCKLAKKEGSVCSKCYASKGCYIFPSAQKAREKRFQATKHPQWVEAMVQKLSRCKIPYFRWHDSGDIYSYEYLEKIMSVCRQLPDIGFWLPTMEFGLIDRYLSEGHDIPENTTIRITSPFIGELSELPEVLKQHPRVLQAGVSLEDTFECHAARDHSSCGACRACWELNVDVVSYPLH